jgi:uncharacterized protein YgbK (DUF1537 family)
VPLRLPARDEEATMLWAALADDLTGGLELAAAMAAEGLDTRFVTGPAAVAGCADAQAVVVAQKTRVAPPEDALRAFAGAADALLAAGAPRLFFKYCATFDSTDRGNIGPCSDLLLERSGAAGTAYCSSFPEYGRAVFQGHLFAGDRLISESPKRHDPLTPMTDPDLVRVLQRQTSRHVGLVPHEVVREGADAIRRRLDALAGAGVPHAIVDAIHHGDLRAISAATADDRLMTGNTSIAAHYPARWRERGLLRGEAAPVRLPAVAGPAVVLAGSCADRTLEQLRRFGERHRVWWVDLEGIDDADAAADALAGPVARAMHEGPVAVATGAAPQAVRRVQERLGVAGAAELGERLLGGLARRLHAVGARRFLVAGGETSGAVLQHLGVDRLRVGPFVSAFMPVAVGEDAAGEPLAFCLKSGKLGGDDAFGPVLERMAEGG